MSSGREKVRASMAELERLLVEPWQAARRDWPDIDVPLGCFVAHVAHGGTASDTMPALDALHTAELYLCCACAAGDEKAIALLESRHFHRIETALARKGFSPAQADEIKQILRKQLFVRRQPGERPRIAEYSGRGDLGAWLRVTAIRAALKLVRKERHEVLVEDEARLEASIGQADPELDFIKDRYHAAFKQAFHQAMGSLSDRQKNLLRQHFLDGVGVLRLAALYDVHRATMARWLAETQHTVLSETKRSLMKDLHVSRRECDSLLRLVRSRMHVTLKRLLAHPAP
jgi:RNA polymerase sigma-70 factor, ECF subfamily